MRTIKDVKGRVRVGTRLLCVENTYRPELNGTVRTIIKAGASVLECEMNGTRHRMEWKPGVTILDADTFRIPMDGQDSRGRPIERLAGHSVTLRFLAD